MKWGVWGSGAGKDLVYRNEVRWFSQFQPPRSVIQAWGLRNICSVLRRACSVLEAVALRFSLCYLTCQFLYSLLPFQPPLSPIPTSVHSTWPPVPLPQSATQAVVPILLQIKQGSGEVNEDLPNRTRAVPWLVFNYLFLPCQDLDRWEEQVNRVSSGCEKQRERYMLPLAGRLGIGLHGPPHIEQRETCSGVYSAHTRAKVSGACIL